MFIPNLSFIEMLSENRWSSLGLDFCTAQYCISVTDLVQLLNMLELKLKEDLGMQTNLTPTV